jgi:ATP-dependent DNA helicase RecG
MNLEDLQRIASGGESATVEFKRSTAEASTAARTLCAMLNGQRGGMVLFGIENDGSIVGQQVGEQTHDRVRAEIRKIEPPVFPDLESILVTGNRSILVVTVSGGTGLYRYDNKPYERFGPTTSVMSESEYQRRLLEHMHAITRWENRVSPLSIDDLEFKDIAVTVSEAIRIGRLGDPGSREIEGMLNGLQLIKDGQLLHAAVVLFGRADRMFASYPQCGLRLARFRGLDKTEFVDSRQVFGNAFHLYQQAQQFFIDHLPIAGRVEGFYRIDTPRYPPDAFREALVNAICHRDYSEASGSIDIAIYDDRLEVISTGGLRFGLTVEQLKGEHQSRPWNPLIAQAFYLRGIIEKWGRGTLRMADYTREAGLGEPVLIDDRLSFTVRFVADQSGSSIAVAANLSPIQQEIWNVLHATGRASLRDIRARLDKEYSVDQVRRGLQALREKGYARQQGATQASTWELKQTPG